MPNAEKVFAAQTETIRRYADMLDKGLHSMTKHDVTDIVNEMENLTRAIRIMNNTGELDKMLKQPAPRNCP